jgi:hypothetical protein
MKKKYQFNVNVAGMRLADSSLFILGMPGDKFTGNGYSTKRGIPSQFTRSSQILIVLIIASD